MFAYRILRPFTSREEGGDDRTPRTHDISGGSGLQGPAEGLVLRRHNVGMGRRGPCAVPRNGPPRNHAPTLPGLLSSPYDGVGRQRDPGDWRRGGVHPARMHRPSTACQRGLQQGSKSQGEGSVPRLADGAGSGQAHQENDSSQCRGMGPRR